MAHDDDGDGQTNFQEFLGGTDPLDPSGFLGLSVSRLLNSRPRLAFTAVAGKTYTVQFRGDLSGGAWQKLFDADAPAATMMEREEATAIADRVRFFRLVTPRAP